MIISITVKNYRSIKTEQTLSLEAGSSNLKSANTFYPLENKKIKLVKSAVIYGPNASGKTNLIRLMWTIQHFVVHSTDLKTGDPIPKKYYDPFLLDLKSKSEPIEVSIEFIAQNKKRHKYSLSYTDKEIISEYLGVYETSRISKIFERKDGNEFVELGESMQIKEDKRILKNHLYLSKIGNTPNSQFQEIFLYFKSLEVWNAVFYDHVDELYRKIQGLFKEPGQERFQKRLSKLISIADTKISSVEVSERGDNQFASLPEDVKANVIKKYKYQTFGIHPVFEDKNEVNVEKFEFNNQESQGTKIVFSLGGLILDAFEKPNPTVIFLDEFDNSLHPDLAKFLVELFHNPKVNKNNSQLVFATHETTLLDKRIFRKDQIWFVDKDDKGSSDIYCINEFKEIKNLRSDIPFDKWYKTGKFGALPNIMKFEFISEYEEENVH